MNADQPGQSTVGQPPSATSDAPPPHPMTALRKSERIGQCVICDQHTYYVCSSCASRDAFCSPQHILQGWAEHSAHCDRSRVISGEDAISATQEAVWLDGSQTTADEENPWIHSGPPPYAPAILDQSRMVIGMYANPTRGSLSRVPLPLVITNNVDGSGITGRAAAVWGYIDEPVVTTVVAFGDDLKPRDSPLLIVFAMNDYLWGQKENRCIAELTRGTEGAIPWFGPVLVLKLAKHSPYDLANMRSVDKKDIKGYFARFRS